MNSQDFLHHNARRFGFWVLPVLAIISMQLLLSQDLLPNNRWVFNGTWSLALLVMGVGCVLNAHRCHRVHCWFTGPYMLLMSAVMFLSMLHWLPGDPAPGLLANIAGGGTLFLWFVPEWIFGKYFGKAG